MKLLKRRYGNRAGWNRILKREYAQSFLDTKEFIGYITLLHTVKVTEPLHVIYDNKKVCIVDDGYTWLQQFPMEANHSVTAMFNADGDIVQWYIDICLPNGVENGIPWIDDLFLDIVLLPSGEMIIKDADELENALVTEVINQLLYDLAWNELNKIKTLINRGIFDLLKLSNYHKKTLFEQLK